MRLAAVSYIPPAVELRDPIAWRLSVLVQSDAVVCDEATRILAFEIGQLVGALRHDRSIRRGESAIGGGDDVCRRDD